MTASDSRAPAASRRALFAAAVLVGAIGVSAGAVVTSSLRLDGATGDWRGASEGLYRSGQPGILMAGRQVVVHFHGLDGRPAVLEVVAAARPASPAVILIATAGRERLEVPVGLEATSVRMPIPRGTHDVDLFIEANAIFRVSRIAVIRSLSATTAAVIVMTALLGVTALVMTWRTGPRGAALVWGGLASLAAPLLWTFAADPASSLRVAAPTRDALRVAVVAALWLAGLAFARSRLASAAAIVGTVALLHLPTVWYGFHQDDFVLARGWSWKELASTLHGEFDPSGMIPSYYRPMVRLSWALDHAWWGPWTAGYHATNLCLHAAAGVVLVALLRRLALPAPGALLGALAWVAHPLAASTTAWVSARGDSLMAIFYLAALLAFSAPGAPTRRSQVTLALLSALAFGTKEMAASLLLAALLLHRVLLPRPDRALRRRRLAVIAAVTAAYVVLWALLFAGKLVGRVSSGPRWAGFDLHDPGHWLRLIPALYAPVFFPTWYEEWWLTPLEGWSWLYLLGALAVVAVSWWAGRGTPRGGASATVGVVWPLLTVLPLLGLPSTLDLYRLGYLVAVAIAFVVAGIAIRVERSFAALAVLAALLAASLSPLSIDAARAWAPDGFRGREFLHWKGTEPTWVGQLTPEMRGQFQDTVAWHCHARRWAFPDSPCP
ncbi:MAG TPA: hypothetical protein VFT38_14415 [Vicinamibacteria bacterium]|nr:hypothetical protein [Vicinamibacteria bacterium]